MTAPRTLCALLGALALLGLPQTAGAADPATNAALKYYQGFELLTRLDKEQQKLLEQWDTIPLDGAAVKLLDDGRHTLLYLQRGAKLAHCNWGLDYEDGPTLLISHLQPARNTARLAALRMRYRFEQGDPQGALEDFVATLVLSRHVASDPILISILVQYAIEATAIEALAGHLPKLGTPALQTLAARLETLPPASTVAQAVRLIEKEQMLNWMVRKIKESEKQGQDAWREVIKQIAASEKEAEVFFKTVGPASAAEVLRIVEGMAQHYDEMAKLLPLPKDQFEAQWPGFVQKARAANPMAAQILPSMDHFLASHYRAGTRMALFKAAIAVAQGGPDRLKTIRDPFGQGPFEYRALPQGFELKSKLTYKGEPVKLTVGQAKKQ
jgi:hypothetical protein